MAKDNVHYGYGEAEAHQFVNTLANRLGVGADNAIPAYEDAWYYLWKERRLPANVDPFNSNLEDPEERAHLARIFEQGLQSVVGYALPLRVRASVSQGAETEWESGPWFLRPQRMYLTPGDSPIGFRLPLDSLPWSTPGDYHHIYERDPAENRELLPKFSENGFSHHPHGQWNGHGRAVRTQRVPMHQVAGVGGPGASFGDLPDDVADSIPESAAATALATNQPPQFIVRTALCVEARQGTLHMFMPPVGHVEDYLHLVAAIEETAAELNMPVRIEGYTPPHDYRLTHFKVTPDPGVIEVNLQPARKWDELVANTTTLYEEARKRGWVPKNSCSTAATPAPAVGITWF